MNADASPETDSHTAPRLRLDKWLWHARFFKSRARAGTVAGSGHVRINGERAQKPATAVRIGDVLTFPQEKRVRVIRIEALGSRRGPAPEAQTLYTDLDPLPERAASETIIPASPTREAGQGRPTKRARREIEAFRRSDP
ncbi:MAG: RNA-binding S4 domain-containing protein [Pseudomonadota bacterium]